MNSPNTVGHTVLCYSASSRHEYKLQDNASKFAQQLVKHYASYILKAPLEFKVKLVKAMEGEEE